MWKVATERPEEKFHGKASEFYASEGKRYEKKGLKRIQQGILLRALQLCSFPLHSKILDAGCGTGFGLEVLKELGYEATGIDVSPELLEVAKKKKLKVFLADMRSLPFPKESFDGIVSISAFQWLLAEERREKENAEKAAKEFYRVLKPKGSAVVQFYPKSEEELLLAGKAFKRAGFKVVLQTDNERNPRKRRSFIVLKRT